MFNANTVNAALALVETAAEEQHTSYYFACNETVQLAGDSLWGYTQAGDVVTVTGVNVHANTYGDEVYYDVYVALAEERLVYGDAALSAAVSRLLNMRVDYTEQGMQDEGLVSLEA